MKISFYFKKGKISLQCKKCNSLEKGIGLMFSRRENAEILLFEFSKPRKATIHSLFVFFPFVALWLDEKNKVINHQVVKPFTLAVTPKRAFSKLIEIPINEKYEKITKIIISRR